MCGHPSLCRALKEEKKNSISVFVLMRFPNKVADRMCRPRVCVFVCARRTELPR